MGPEVGFGMGGKAAGRPRPSLLVRLTEMAGMGAILWGLGMGPWWLVAIGGVMVVGSYAAYRRKHGPFPPGDGGSDGIGGDESGGGD